MNDEIEFHSPEDGSLPPDLNISKSEIKALVTEQLIQRQTLFKDLYRKFDSIFKINPWSWYGMEESFAVIPKGMNNIYFIHRGPLKGMGFAELSQDNNETLVIVKGWNNEALYRKLLRETQGRSPQRFELDLFVCFKRKKKDLVLIEEILSEIVYEKKFAKMDEFPLFLCNKPCHLLGLVIDDDAIKELTAVLNQALGVFLRYENDKEIVWTDNPNEVWGRSLDENGKWTEGWAPIPKYVDPIDSLKFELDEEKISKALILPDDLQPVEFGWTPMPKAAIYNKYNRRSKQKNLIPVGYFFAICPTTQSPHKIELEASVFFPEDDFSFIKPFFCDFLLNYILKHGHRPKEVYISSNRMMKILRPLQNRLPFKLVYHSNLPIYEKFFNHTLELAENNNLGFMEGTL